jgi:PQQ system protein
MYALRPLAAALAAGALALAGCGGDDNNGDGNASTGAAESSGASTGASGAAGTVKLSETEFKIDPANPAVAKAGSVTIDVKNDGQIVHALEVQGPSGEAKTAAIPAGNSAKLTVDLSKPGTYEMYCPIGNHKDMGMKGTLVVAGGGSGAVKEDSGSGDGDSSGGSGSNGY